MKYYALLVISMLFLYTPTEVEQEQTLGTITIVEREGKLFLKTNAIHNDWEVEEVKQIVIETLCEQKQPVKRTR